MVVKRLLWNHYANFLKIKISQYYYSKPNLLSYGGLYRIIQKQGLKNLAKNVIEEGKIESDLKGVGSILRGLRGNLKETLICIPWMLKILSISLNISQTF